MFPHAPITLALPQGKWNAMEDKPTVIGTVAGGLLTLYIVSGILERLDALPGVRYGAGTRHSLLLMGSQQLRWGCKSADQRGQFQHLLGNQILVSSQ